MKNAAVRSFNAKFIRAVNIAIHDATRTWGVEIEELRYYVRWFAPLNTALSHELGFLSFPRLFDRIEKKDDGDETVIDRSEESTGSGSWGYPTVYRRKKRIESGTEEGSSES